MSCIPCTRNFSTKVQKIQILRKQSPWKKQYRPEYYNEGDNVLKKRIFKMKQELLYEYPRTFYFPMVFPQRLYYFEIYRPRRKVQGIGWYTLSRDYTSFYIMVASKSHLFFYLKECLQATRHISCTQYMSEKVIRKRYFYSRLTFRSWPIKPLKTIIQDLSTRSFDW